MTRLIRLSNTSIFKQLQLEEALLRASSDEWCLINFGSPPAIVMGISGKQDELIYPTDLPIIRRFTGGGCVVVDENTFFVTFIGNMQAPTPQKIHEWVKEKISPVFLNLPFSLRENDYLLNERKVGGNAQAITKNRFLHHTSFLYKFNTDRMNLLKMPKKVPDYRAGRSHLDFVTTLSPFFPSPEMFFEKITAQYSMDLSPCKKELEDLLAMPHRKSLIIL